MMAVGWWSLFRFGCDLPIRDHAHTANCAHNLIVDVSTQLPEVNRPPAQSGFKLLDLSLKPFNPFVSACEFLLQSQYFFAHRWSLVCG
jgi:hypothetical protein